MHEKAIKRKRDVKEGLSGWNHPSPAQSVEVHWVRNVGGEVWGEDVRGRMVARVQSVAFVECLLLELPTLASERVERLYH